MAYAPPTKADLRAAILRDLRDPTNQSFTATEADDYINEGITSLNRIHPIEAIRSYSIYDVDGTWAPTPLITDLTDIFHVEVFNSNYPQWSIPPNDTVATGRTGWDFFQGRVYMSSPWLEIVHAWLDQVHQDTDLAQFNLWGYLDRDLPVDDTSPLDLDNPQDEYGIRTYARSRGFERLMHDRSLYQQWQTQQNNSDVSATQLTSMAVESADAWRRFQREYRRLRRSPVGSDYN